MMFNATIIRRVISIAGALAFVILAEPQVSAQRFQAVYGGPFFREAGRYGVAQLAGGGYIAVGESFSPNVGITSDIYVVRTNPNGTLLWSFTYNIGNNDSATDVIETANGDLVICGVTGNGGVCPASRDMFILKLNAAGTILAVNTFGTATSDEIAWNIVEAVCGDGVTTFPGDYILAGSTTNQSGAGRDGYIVRTNSNLQLIWDAQYGGPTSQDDFFYGVEEARVGANPNAGCDIVAVGGTNTWGVGGYEVFLVRVNGNNGVIGIAPQNAGVYGGTRNDSGHAVIEIRNGPNAGSLAITGISDSRPFPSTNSEVLMLQTTGNPCVFVANQYAGEDGPDPDGGIDLKEDDFAVSPGGGVIVTGFTDFGNGAVSPLNAFLQRFALGTMTPAGAGMAYGGMTDDWGWSVNICRNITPNQTQGYIVAGFTTSPNLIPPGDPQQLYLFKTDVNLFAAGCHETPFVFSSEQAGLIGQCVPPVIQRIGFQCRPAITQQRQTWELLICYFLPQARERGGNGNDGVSGVESPATLSLNEGTVTSYPNPVTSGSQLNLRFDLMKATDVTISVSDIMGRKIYRDETSIAAGSAVRTIETTGWPSGSYIVHIESGGRRSATRVVILDR